MKATMNDDGWRELEEYVGTLQTKMDDKTLKQVLRKVGQAMKKKVLQYAPGKTQNPSYADFNQSEYKHIREDITYKVRKSSTGQLYVSVKGGKTTGYKWHWLNEGHIAQNGRFVPGTHFVDKAEASSADDINEAIDEFLEDILNG